METPEGASVPKKKTGVPPPQFQNGLSDEAYIMNPFPGKGVLTTLEALEAINQLSMMLKLDQRRKNG